MQEELIEGIYTLQRKAQQVAAGREGCVER